MSVLGKPSKQERAISGQCPSTFIQCTSTGGCVPIQWQCDGENDCSDGSDEQNCGRYGNKCQPMLNQCISYYISAWLENKELHVFEKRDTEKPHSTPCYLVPQNPFIMPNIGRTNGGDKSRLFIKTKYMNNPIMLGSVGGIVK